MKHWVDCGIYVTFGVFNARLLEKTGFHEEDTESLKSNQAFIPL